MQNILLKANIGHDLITINLLLSKHRTLETEILEPESTLQVSISGGDELIQPEYFGVIGLIELGTDNHKLASRTSNVVQIFLIITLLI